MEVISLQFAFLALLTVFTYYLLNQRYRITYLAILSCGFVAVFNIYWLIYLVTFTFINYLFGLWIQGSKSRLGIFRIGLLLNLSQIIFLSYSTFLIDPFIRLFGSDAEMSRLADFLEPIGISYFTLQAIGYLINIKMGWEKPEKKFLDFLLYIVFFPKFLSGPIERSNHFLPQLKKLVVFEEKNVIEGFRIALIGFFQKVAIANNLGLFVSATYSNVDSTGSLNLWIIVLIQPLYLYFDFCGYTNIAIGFAKAFGIELLPNFNKPFLSENVTTFWKKFHMSLSLWFNDYIFKQLSFRYRRLGIYASVFAVFATFILFGIWHGAGWNFMMLGLVQALAINYEFFTKRLRATLFTRLPHILRVWIGRLLTYTFFGVSLVLFFSDNLSSALIYYRELFDHNGTVTIVTSGFIFVLSLTFAFVFIIGEILSYDYKSLYDHFEKLWVKNKILRMVVYYVALFFIITQLSGPKTFIYQMF